MTLLIVGGMLIIALLAILGAVFLSVNDQRANRARTNGEANIGSTSYPPGLTRQLSETRQAEQSTTLRQSMPLSTEQPVRSTAINQQSYALNGQFHELTVELQTLYQHAWELERRLRTLSEVADRIEKTHSNQIDSEEQIHAQPSAESTL